MQVIHTTILALVCGVVLCAGSEARAQPLSPSMHYSMEHIPVEIRAENAVVARDLALKQAFNAAFQLLAKDLTARFEMNRLLDVLPQDATPYVGSYSIKNESFLNQIYRAEITVRFVPSMVHDFFESRDIMLVNQKETALLLVPMLYDQDAVYLWEDDNEWRQAWADFVARNQQQDWVIPYGDLQDMGIAPTREIKQGNYHLLKPLQWKYRANRAAIVELHLHGVKSEVIIRAPDGIAFSSRMMKRDLDFSRVIERMAEDVLSYASYDVIEGRRQFIVEATYNSYADWRNMQRLLAQSPQILNITMQLLNKHSAQLKILYTNELSLLKNNLQALGLVLYHEDDTWYVTLGKYERLS